MRAEWSVRLNRKRPFSEVFLLCFLFCLFINNISDWCSPFQAQAQVLIPPAGQSGVSEKSLRQSQPQFKPPEQKIPDITLPESRQVLDPDAGPVFFVKKVEIVGNTIFDAATLAPLVDVGEGKEISLGKLRLMGQKVTAFYVEKGYILSHAVIPEQEVKEGLVKILVVEGRIGEIRVSGNQRIQKEDILDSLDRVVDEKVMRKQSLIWSLLDLNDIMGLSSKSIFQRGKVPGTTDLELEIKETLPYTISFDGDNFGSRFTGEQRFGLTATGGNLLFFGDRFSVRGVKTNLDQDFISPSYSFLINNYGTRARFSYTHAEFNLGENLAALKAGGDSNTMAFDLTHSLFRDVDGEFRVTVGGESRRFKNFDLTGLTSNDKLADVYLMLGGFVSPFKKGRTYYNFRVQQGIRDDHDSLNSRAGGHGDVTLLSMSLQHYQSAYIGNSYLTIRGFGQLALARVLSADQFAIGGYGTVRGYPLAEAAGDHGYAVSVEYNVPFPFKVPLTDQPGLKSLDQVLTLYGFIDHGRVFIQEARPGERGQELNGAGGGFRINIPKWSAWAPQTSFTFAIGFPNIFNNRPPSDGSSHTLYLGGAISY